MSYGSIYKIQFPNGTNYIGLTTTSLEQRKKEHKHKMKSGDTRCIYNALRKYYMEGTFELIQIDTADTVEELCEKEKEYIIKYNSYYMDGNGYNMTMGGEGTNGYVFTEEDKRKNSEIRKKYFQEHPEEYERMKEMRKKQMDNPELMQQINESMKKYWENPEARNRQSEITKKHHEEHPETTIQQAEKRKKTFQENPEILERMRESAKKRYKDNPELGKEHGEKIKKRLEENPAEREKYSKAQKKRFENPEERERNRQLSKKHWENPEARERMSEKKKQYYKDNPEASEKNREAQKNRSSEWIKKRNDTLGKNKPFDVFTKDGTFIKTFTYPFEAKEYLQKEYQITSSPAMGEVLNGSKKSSLGFVFKYKEI